MASPKKILVVDDEYEIVEVVKAVLKTKGYQVIVAYDGEEAYKQIVKERPDLLVSDLRMPKMSGLELCKKIRANPDIAETPILIISSLMHGIDKPDEYWAAGLKSDDFLPKPFEPLGLLGRVEYLLRKGDYVSDIAAPTSPRRPFRPETPVPEESSSHPHIRKPSDDPAEVVRVFVESWNTMNFSKEYDTLGEEMLGGLTREDYVGRRAQLYGDENGASTVTKVLDTNTKISHNVAAVDCLREDVIKGVPRPKDERYTLKKTTAGWKIIAVKSRPINYSVE